ncbi:hypothetical protein SBOR_2823 [Sclerotinia borealis F-4128]|uniref:Tat pathway signal sequence n=1 Tax=Sclerotinia borealis (strain F-4128) TaxID=1432307 RepID=W9CJB2_SCLBF|nr:hypothetical protein SBOR_2823 [Sclerotinia borealis F-4128]
MENVSDDKEELLQKCQFCCEGENYHPDPVAPHKYKKYWIFSTVIHIAVIIFTISILQSFYSPRRTPKNSVPFLPVNHDSHLVGDILSPLNNHAQHKIEALSTDSWDPELYFGEPTYESDRAWNALIYPRSFRVHKDEAVRLNMTESILLQPGDDFGTMLGALHNLHCLRRIRQMLYSDYYYPDASPEEKEYNRNHAYWKSLQQILESRNFPNENLMANTGPLN